MATQPTPHPTASRIRRVYTLERTWFQDADADLGHGEREGEGRENTAKLNNSSTEQHFDAIFHMKIVIPFLLLIALTKCAYLLLASLASKNGVLYSEGRAYKREPELAASPQSTALLYIQQETPLWRTVNQEQSRPQQHTWNCQPLLFFPLNYYCT